MKYISYDYISFVFISLSSASIKSSIFNKVNKVSVIGTSYRNENNFPDISQGFVSNDKTWPLVSNSNSKTRSLTWHNVLLGYVAVEKGFHNGFAKSIRLRTCLEFDN